MPLDINRFAGACNSPLLTVFTFNCIVSSKMAELVKCSTCGQFTVAGGFCEHCGKSLNTCQTCKARLLSDALFCPRCGTLISEKKRLLQSQQRISWAWWLMPIVSPLLLFSPWVGGAVAWAVNRDKNPRKARYILFFGVSITVILAIVTFVLGWGIVF